MKNAVLYFTACMFCTALFFSGCVKEDDAPNTQNVAMERAQMVQIAKDAYVYGFPMVLMETTKRYMTNPLPGTGNLPLNQIKHLRSFADSKFKDFVLPDADIFYSFAWLDLSKEPVLFEIPDVGGRYTLFTFLDAWTDVIASLGKRTTGTEVQKFAVTGPRWEGELPEGFKEYKSDTNTVWMIGQIQVNGKQDAETAVKKIQDEIKLYPLSAYGKKYAAPKGRADDTLSVQTPLEQVLSMNISDFFNMFNQLMVHNPPRAEDAKIMDKILDLGVAPGMRFDLSTFDFDTQEAFREIPKWMKEYMANMKNEGAEKGWHYDFGRGSYMTDYRARAKTAYLNLGAAFDEDFVSVFSYADSDNEKFDSLKKYVLHFDKDEIPQVNALWSISLYDNDGFLAKTAMNRSLSNNSLKFNKDGSLDVYIQKDNPGKDKQSNWISSLEDGFTVAIGCYWPKESVTERKWRAPAINKAR